MAAPVRTRSERGMGQKEGVVMIWQGQSRNLDSVILANIKSQVDIVRLGINNSHAMVKKHDFKPAEENPLIFFQWSDGLHNHSILEHLLPLSTLFYLLNNAQKAKSQTPPGIYSPNASTTSNSAKTKPFRKHITFWSDQIPTIIPTAVPSADEHKLQIKV